MEVKTEIYTGADCSGSSGAINRTLTLANTGTTSADGFLISVSGLVLALTSEYTVVHNSSASVITFLNALWDDQPIVSNYYQQRTGTVAAGSTQYDKMRADVQAIITEHGQEYTLIRQAETVASMGDVTDVSGTEYTIYSMVQDITKKDRQIHEMGLAVPGNSKAFFFHEYPDSITGNGTVTPDVGDIMKDSDNNYWRVEQILGEKKAGGEEIFRTGIIKNVELSS